MKLTKHQIVPFPLPEHLASFISCQLDSPLEFIGSNLKTPAKALHISRKRQLGKFVLRCLKSSNKPVFVSEGLTIYIAVSENLRIADKKMVECRYSFLQLDETEIDEITDVFETLFRTSLISFLDGAYFGNYSKKKDRGKYAAIIEFLNKYDMAHDDKAVERYRKLYDREKTSGKKLITKYL